MKMKKRAVVVLAGMLLLAGMGSSAYAATDTTSTDPSAPAATATVQTITRAHLLESFGPQLHQLNALREERLNVKEQIVKKEDQIMDLLAAAKKAKNKEALKQAKELQAQVHTLRQDINTEAKTVESDMKDFRQAIKDRNADAATTAITGALTAFQDVNNKLTQEASLLDQIITVLQ